MTHTYQAVFEHGVFRLLNPVKKDIPEGQSVRLIVETIDAPVEMPEVEISLAASLAQQLHEKLTQWEPGKSAMVEQLITEILTLADQDSLDLMRSRAVEQEVLDILDETNHKPISCKSNAL